MKNLLKTKHDNPDIPDPETLANYFSTSPVKVQSEIPPTSKSFWDYLSPKVETPITLKEIDLKSLHQHICKLSNKKACGSDGISNQLLKDAGGNILPPLKHLFDTCIKCSKIPIVWKEASIRGIYKTGDKMDPKNYRPISLLSSVSKLFEKELAKQITDFLIEQKVLVNEQHGFRKSFSTCTSLLALTNEIYKNIEQSKYTSSLFLDLSKAFDTVDTNILLNKLTHYGVRNNANAIILDYLTNRSLRKW